MELGGRWVSFVTGCRRVDWFFFGARAVLFLIEILYWFHFYISFICGLNFLENIKPSQKITAQLAFAISRFLFYVINSLVPYSIPISFLAPVV